MINWYRKRIIKAVEHHIHEYLYHEHKGVKPKPIKGMFNFRCFENAAQYAFDNKGCEIVLGIYIETEGKTILHFWNTDKDGNHVEVTLGFRVEALTYYPLKTLDQDEILAVGGIFDEALEYFTLKFTTKWQRFILNGQRVL